MLLGNNIYFKYKPESSFILKNVCISAKKGEILLLKGPNGSGKTTLGLILSGIIPKIIKGVYKGSVSVDDKEINTLSNEFDNVGYLFQNPDNYFTTVIPLEEIKLSLAKSKSPLNHDEIIDYFEIRSILDMPLSKLSFGQKQLVALASLLILNPDYLILDEPFAHIDQSHKNKIISLINDLPRMWEKGILLFTHEVYDDLNVDKEMFLDKGGIRGDWLDDHLEITKKTNQEEVYKKKSVEIVNTRDLSFKYRTSPTQVLKAVNFSINNSEIVGISGPNGSGKSTFLLSLSCLLKNKHGIITYTDYKQKPVKLKRYDIKKMALVLQNPDFQLFGNSVEEELENTSKFLELGNKNLTRIKNEFKTLWPDIKMNSDPFSLSYGQKRILSIFCALLASPKILLLDEPFSGLDLENKRKMINIIFSLKQKESSVIIVSHNLTLINNICDKVYLMENGELHEQI